MQFNEYQKLAARTINPALTPKGQTHHALFGLAAEAGEVAGLYQKVLQGHALDVGHLKKEIGDVMWMLAELCTATGIEMQEVCETNIDKLKARYPDGFSTERSIHRGAMDI